MRKLIAAAAGAAALALAAPASAETLKEVTTHGIILVIGDMEIPVSYTPDGKLSAMDGAITGTWRIDGEKLCTSSTRRSQRDLRRLSQGQEVRRQLHAR